MSEYTIAYKELAALRSPLTKAGNRILDVQKRITKAANSIGSLDNLLEPLGADLKRIAVRADTAGNAAIAYGAALESVPDTYLKAEQSAYNELDGGALQSILSGVLAAAGGTAGGTVTSRGAISRAEEKLNPGTANTAAEDAVPNEEDEEDGMTPLGRLMAEQRQAQEDSGAASKGTSGSGAGLTPERGQPDIAAPDLINGPYAEYRGEVNADFVGQCVGYAKGRLSERFDISIGSWGNGGDAASNIGASYSGQTINGYNISYSADAGILTGGSVASFNPSTANPVGHAVFVENVWTNESGTTMVSFSEANTTQWTGRIDGVIYEISLDTFINLPGGLKDFVSFNKV